jgi:hypothetical protein
MDDAQAIALALEEAKSAAARGVQRHFSKR